MDAMARMRKAQAMIEYVIVLVMMSAAALGMAYLVRAARHSAHRTVDLISSDSP